jgi:hypothetical protein
MARPLYAYDPLGVDLEQTLYALDPRSISASRCFLGWLPQAQGRRQNAHAARFSRQHPPFIHVTEGKMHDVSILDEFLPEPGPFYERHARRPAEFLWQVQKPSAQTVGCGVELTRAGHNRQAGNLDGCLCKSPRRRQVLRIVSTAA